MRTCRILASSALGLGIGFASYPAWWWACLAWCWALGLPPGAPALPGALAGARGLLAVVLAPLLEETLYRGALLSALAARLGAAPALGLTSALFALPHGAPARVASTFLVGLVLGATRLASGSLALCVGLHAGLNLAALACGGPPRGAALPPAVAALAGGLGLALALLWLRRRTP